MAADLQEPPALMLSFFEALSSGEYDIISVLAQVDMIHSGLE